jgi:hypothetical protein
MATADIVGTEKIVDGYERHLHNHTSASASHYLVAYPLCGSFSPRGARSKGDQQPDGQVAHNQKLQNILDVDIGIPATQALRARKTRK